jgi:CheY-like chemotaxis protein
VALNLVRTTRLPPCLADAAQLRSALVNIALNARDAMDGAGSLTITLGVAVLDAAALAGNDDALPGPFVEITLADTGAGIPAALLPRVFDPFFTTKPMGKGTGLGLAQVFGFVRQSAGHVRIESAEGRGTTLTLYLPVTEAVPATRPPARIPPGIPLQPATQPAPQPAPQPQPATQPAPQPATPPPLRAAPRRDAEAGTHPARILLIDDNAALLALSRSVLAAAGHVVTTAADGDAGLALLAGGEEVDLVVCDVVMPGGHDGVAVARRLHEDRPDLPVILISGYAPDGTVEAPNVRAVLGKPFSRERLVNTVTAALAASRGDEA